jgi:pyruvate/2-oxoacid:ferredoxin oxidoreductase alpha subunit
LHIRHERYRGLGQGLAFEHRQLHLAAGKRLNRVLVDHVRELPPPLLIIQSQLDGKAAKLAL